MHNWQHSTDIVLNGLTILHLHNLKLLTKCVLTVMILELPWYSVLKVSQACLEVGASMIRTSTLSSNSY